MRNGWYFTIDDRKNDHAQKELPRAPMVMSDYMDMSDMRMYVASTFGNHFMGYSLQSRL